MEITSESCEHFGFKTIMNGDDCRPAYKSIHDTSVFFITLGSGVNNLYDKTQGCQLLHERSLITGEMEWNLYFTVAPEATQDCSETLKCYCSVETHSNKT